MTAHEAGLLLQGAQGQLGGALLLGAHHLVAGQIAVDELHLAKGQQQDAVVAATGNAAQGLGDAGRIRQRLARQLTFGESSRWMRSSALFIRSLVTGLSR